MELGLASRTHSNQCLYTKVLNVGLGLMGSFRRELSLCLQADSAISFDGIVATFLSLATSAALWQSDLRRR